MPTPTILKLGSAGEEVKRLNDILRMLNYPANASSLFDGTTVKGVEKFQKDNGINPDGKVWVSEKGDTWPVLLGAFLKKQATDMEATTTSLGKVDERSLRIFLDPGHGQGNKRAGVYDSGAESNGVKEAVVALQWAQALAPLLIARGHQVAFSRTDQTTPTSISSRTVRAKGAFGGQGADLLLSLHCNAANGAASGTETFYRHASSKTIAQRVNDALVAALGTKDRGIKTEASSQHPGGIHVLSYRPDAILVELGFIDNAGDRSKLTDPETVKRGCKAIADAL